MKLVAFDLETTGVDAEKDRVVEFSFIELDEQLNEKGRWSKLVNPGIPIPAETIAIHNITDEMVANHAPFATHAARIQRLIEDAVLIGHSVRFDVSFIHAELVRAGQPGLKVNHPTIDTVQIERYVNSHRLGACYERYTGKPLDGAHRSEADIEATVDVLRGQRKVHDEALPESLEGLIGPQLQAHFNPDAVAREWLDHGRKFYRDGEKTYFAFGKFRDQLVDNNNSDHTSYLSWMRDRDFPDDTKAIVKALLGEAGVTQQTLGQA